MPKITKRLVDGLRPPPDGRELQVWDSEIKGFGLRLMPSGVGSYFVFYRNAEGRQRKLTLGRVGALTPDEARDLARLRLSEKLRGGDPSAERRKVRSSITVAELCDRYLEYSRHRVKVSTHKMDVSRIERHVKPLIGHHRVASLTAEDVLRMQSDIIAGKTGAPRAGRGGRTTGGKAAAGRTVGMLGSILEYARQLKLVTENVARGVKKPPEGKVTRFLSFGEIARLGAAIRNAREVEGNASGLAAVEFLLMTGCRRMEALALPVEWVDASAKCLRLQDSKSGYQVRPIGAPALSVIASVEHRNGWVFPAVRGEGHFVGLPKVLGRLCRSAGIEPISPHVLRHTFASVAAGMSYSELTIAGLLGHSRGGITARYSHVPDAALVSAADAVAQRIRLALNGQVALSPSPREYAGQ
ncbi:tyrosine-type recombinase/integrase [Aestuariivirga sp.]|uniref:tyrosine-type recombinase/integrase n=1 Tax=Aestuariivirga sp. TaxID=2650926 RepID=UPI0039198D02